MIIFVQPGRNGVGFDVGDKTVLVLAFGQIFDCVCGVFIFKFLTSLNRKGRAAAAGFLDIRILKDKARLHQLVFVVEFGAAQIKQTFHIDQNLAPSFSKTLSVAFGSIEIDFVLQARATATDNFHAQSLALATLGRNHSLISAAAVRSH